MGLVCKNIGKTGRKIRVIMGTAVLIAGVVGCIMTWEADKRLAVGIGLGALALGGFMIFEGMMGWCALRAMGVKTKF